MSGGGQRAAGRANVLAVVPARGGSKGVPRKNLREIGGVPMVARVRRALDRLDFVTRAVVSTDDPEIAAASGLDAPFVRPAALAGDRAAAADVARHALAAMEEIDGRRYDVMLYLEPTAAVRDPAAIEACFDKLVAGGFDAAWTVSPVDPSYHPLKLLRLEGESLQYYDPAGAQIVARQQLAPVYRRNGVCYALTRACVVEHGFLGPRTAAVVTDEMHISVDSDLDIAFVNYMVEKGLVSVDG